MPSLNLFKKTVCIICFFGLNVLFTIHQFILHISQTNYRQEIVAEISLLMQFKQTKRIGNHF